MTDLEAIRLVLADPDHPQHDLIRSVIDLVTAVQGDTPE